MIKKILITTGGTKENIDPVRYIGNYSSGKMGIALADIATQMDYEVLLVSAVEVTDKPYPVKIVKSADDMLNAVLENFPDFDCLIMAAAVADFKPAKIFTQKIKKENKETITLELVKNPDILKEVGKIKRNNQIIIGFCAESENLIQNAQKKIISKNLDYIAANDISRNDIGFGSDYNEITLISKDGTKDLISRTTKIEAAKFIINKCLK